MNNITKWEDCPREDLNKIPLMVANGFTPEFTTTDRINGRTTFENVPHDPVRFRKDNISIGQIYHPTHQWRAWELIEGHYQVTHTTDSIDDMLTFLNTAK